MYILLTQHIYLCYISLCISILEGTEGEQAKDSTGGLHTDLENLDPKLRNAIIKMRKLDKILTKRVRREKEVKRDRILLERRFVIKLFIRFNSIFNFFMVKSWYLEMD
jgi:hypothetical protein